MAQATLSSSICWVFLGTDFTTKIFLTFLRGLFNQFQMNSWGEKLIFCKDFLLISSAGLTLGFNGSF